MREKNKRRKELNVGKLNVPGKLKRRPILIEDITLNGSLINCRSVKPKLKFLSQCFHINKLNLALLNETWLYRSDPQARKLLNDLKSECNIEFIRRDRDSRGGGVAIAFDNRSIQLKKLDLKSLKAKKQFEILAVRGKIKGYSKELTVFSCYLPPRLLRRESNEFMELLSDAISEAKQSSDGWLMVGGDWNGRSLNSVLDLYPDLKILKTAPTRKDRTLDILCTNFDDYIKKQAVCSPLEGEIGQKSDHKIVLFEAKLPRPAAFTWETHEYLQITDEGKKRFTELLNKVDWSALKTAWPDQDKMVEIFHKTLEDLVDSCFAWKKVRRKSNNKPWMTDAILARIDDRKRVFQKQGRSELFNRLNKGIQKTIKVRKKKYEEQITKKLEETGKNNQWYNIYKYLASDEMPERWEVTQLKPDENPLDLANELAVHFSKITNASAKLANAVPSSCTGPGLIPQIDQKNLTDMLRSSKKCNSRVNGDIPKDLINPSAEKLAEALTPIYNACLLNTTWPIAWKVETTIPIPKTISPGDFDDIRPISMTTFWSKLLESYVAKFTLD